MSRLLATMYGPVFWNLVREQRLSPLGPGTPNLPLREALAALQVDSAFAPQSVQDRDMANACLAGLWLYHDFLDESHNISQAINTPTGSYWHGLMHRREPDFENAKYWFRRVGQHPGFEQVLLAAKAIPRGAELPRGAEFLATQPSWDPYRFVDLCAECQAGTVQLDMLCRQIQRAEWQLLFQFCHEKAVGQGPTLRA